MPRFVRSSGPGGELLDYAARALGASLAVIKILDGNEASIGVARNLGAEMVGDERSEAGGRFVVFHPSLWR